MLKVCAILLWTLPFTMISGLGQVLCIEPDGCISIERSTGDAACPGDDCSESEGTEESVVDLDRVECVDVVLAGPVTLRPGIDFEPLAALPQPFVTASCPQKDPTLRSSTAGWLDLPRISIPALSLRSVVLLV